jgi:polygalacturonase
MKSNSSRRGFLGAWLAGGALTVLPAASAASSSPDIPPGIFNVREFGAVADGQTVTTKPLQSAIDAAARAGGTVYFPPGKYLSGTLFLKSHVSLNLEAGAVLLGSTNLADYPRVQPSLRSYTETYVNQSLIYAENQENVSLLGQGTLNGQGAAFPGDYLVRPYLLRFVNCRKVRVADLTMLDSPMWVQHYLGCEDVAIRGLTVHSRCNGNNDGIDIDACQKVRISDCEIFCGDDAIVLKTTLDRPCRDVTVTNCVLSTLCNALKIGTESVGDFDNIVCSNCAIYDTDLAGIALESVDGANLENITISNIVMRNVRSPIFLRLGNRARPIYAGAPQRGLGSFRNVLIQNIQANGADAIGCAIAGLPERAIENVTLSNLRLHFAGGGSHADAGRDIPENTIAYPEYSMFGKLPAYAFYCRHVKNLRILDAQVVTEKEEARPALVCDDTEGLRLAGFEATQGNPLLVLRNTRNAWLQGNQSPDGNDVYLRLEGKHTAGIHLAYSDLRESKKAIERDSEVAPGAVIEFSGKP